MQDVGRGVPTPLDRHLRHHGERAVVVFGVGNVAHGQDVRVVDDSQERVDLDGALIGHGEAALAGQGVALDARGPDHGIRADGVAALQPDRRRLHCLDHGPRMDVDTQLAETFLRVRA